MAMGADQLIAGIAQIAPVWFDREATLAKVISSVDEAIATGCQLVVFGEALVPGYPRWLERTGGAQFDSPVQKAFHAEYQQQAVQIERGDLDAVCERARAGGMAVVLGVVGVAIGVVLLPELSRQVRSGDGPGARRSLNRAAEYALALSLPAAAGLAVLPFAIAGVLFERGAFTAEDTEAVGLVDLAGRAESESDQGEVIGVAQLNAHVRLELRHGKWIRSAGRWSVLWQAHTESTGLIACEVTDTRLRVRRGDSRPRHVR